MIVPFTPGGSTDILARLSGQKFTEAWGQSVTVENRPGAGGSAGSVQIARAPADGYTIGMGHIGTLSVNPRSTRACNTIRSRASSISACWPRCTTSWSCILPCR